MSISDKKGAVWSKAKPIRGKDQAKYRQDPYGNEMYYGSYGKDSEKGWEIDHIKPKAVVSHGVDPGFVDGYGFGRSGGSWLRS